MTLLTEAGPRPAPPVRRRWLRRHQLVAAVVVMVLAAAGLSTWLVLRHMDEKYGPIESGEWGGLYSRQNWVFGPHDSGIRLSTAPGAKARLIESLDNGGSHSVRVASINGDDSVVQIRWSTYRVVPGGSGTGVKTPWHGFPATVPAHGTIRLLVTIRRPGSCPTNSHASRYGGFYYSDRFAVHWDSLLGSHTTTVTDPYGDGTEITIC